MNQRNLSSCVVLIATLLSVWLAACDDEPEYPQLAVTSPAFGNGQTMPVRHTCDGDDVSPPLRFDSVPDEAVSLAVIMDEPEAADGRFTHWLLWGIPVENGFLGADIPKIESPGGGMMQGPNDTDSVGYSGPCPEEEDTDEHRYVLRVYALDEILVLDDGSSRKALEKAMDGRIVGLGKLVGYYRREE